MEKTKLNNHPHQTAWHNISAKEAIKLNDSDASQGLSQDSVKERQAKFGLNVLKQKKQQSLFITFLLQFHQPMIYILLGACVVTLFLQEWVEAAVIFGVVILNAIVGFIQEAKALNAMNALSKTLESESTVIREGIKQSIQSSQLVPGDIVELKSGDKVPADLRLTHVKNLQVNESSLTGESLPVEKNYDALDEDTALADRINMAYSGTLVTFGLGHGLVISTGENTEIGKIQQMIDNADILATPLTKKIKHFSHMVLWVILGLAAVTFIIGMFKGYDFEQMFLSTVALAVGMIPEGLPAVVTITLAIGVGRMAKQNAIIRKLPAVETLGSTTVICSDKTGTLTQNEMTVKNIFTHSQSYEVDGNGYSPEGKITNGGQETDGSQDNHLNEILMCGLLCNDSVLLKNETDDWAVEGDPTEGALLVSARKGLKDNKEIISKHERLDAIPFESDYQYMATLHRFDQEKNVAFIKGSSESLLPKCLKMTLPEEDVNKVLEKIEEYARLGMRVLVFTKKEFSAQTQEINHSDLDNLTFLGLQAMIDPPRPEAIEAVGICQKADVQVKMITGDHLTTAAAIADQLGIQNLQSPSQKPKAINGKDLEKVSPEEFDKTVAETSVFARVTPEQKLSLVKTLQKQGEIAAMTGDGVNDAPALRQADIGIAMGKGGTEVTKEASDIVLTDDKFSTIAKAVEEGRGVFDNLLKFIIWVIPTNLGEGLVIMLTILIGSQLPVLPIQILWINMTTAIFLGLTLAFERKEPSIMDRSPRRPDMPLIERKYIFRTIMVSLFILVGAFGMFEMKQLAGYSEEQARTIAVNIFVFVEMAYLFNCRSLKLSMFKLGAFSNGWLLVGVLAMAGLQVLLTHSPTMNFLFKTAPIELIDWAQIILYSALVYVVVEIEKLIRRMISK